MSWPQACITPISAPPASLTFTCRGVGQTRVCSATGSASRSVRSMQRRAVAVLQHAHDAVAADARGHFGARCLQLLGHACGRLLLLERKLGMLMEMLVEREDVWQMGVDPGFRIFGSRNRHQPQRGDGGETTTCE